MSRGLVICTLCGLKGFRAAHECPHGLPCTFLGLPGDPVDFSRRMCGKCDDDRDQLPSDHRAHRASPRSAAQPTRRSGLLSNEEVAGLTLALTMLATLARSA